MRILLLALGSSAHLVATAQPATPAQSRYRLEHHSVFEHYSPHTTGPVQSWRDSNQQVHEIGGWRAYLRSVQPEGNRSGPEGHADPARPDPVRQPAPAPAATPAPAPAIADPGPRPGPAQKGQAPHHHPSSGSGDKP